MRWKDRRPPISDRMITVVVAGSGQRQDDLPEPLPQPRRRRRGRLEVLTRDRDDAGDEDHRGQPHALPDVDQGHRQQRGLGVDEPGRAVDADQRQPVVDEARVGSMRTWKVRPTPMVLTRTGKKTTERSSPLADDLGGEQQRQQHPQDHLERTR